MAFTESDVNCDHPHFKKIIKTLIIRDEGQHFDIRTRDGILHMLFGYVDIVPDDGGVAFRFVGSESDASEGSIGVIPLVSEITDDEFRIFRDDDSSYKTVRGCHRYSGTKAVVYEKIGAAASKASQCAVWCLLRFAFGWKEAA